MSDHPQLSISDFFLEYPNRNPPFSSWRRAENTFNPMRQKRIVLYSLCFAQKTSQTEKLNTDFSKRSSIILLAQKTVPMTELFVHPFELLREGHHDCFASLVDEPEEKVKEK